MQILIQNVKLSALFKISFYEHKLQWYRQMFYLYSSNSMAPTHNNRSIAHDAEYKLEALGQCHLIQMWGPPLPPVDTASQQTNTVLIDNTTKK